jgi:ribosomal protein S18 acetylase RimI-like enzyme
MANLRTIHLKDLNAVNALLSKAFTQGREDDGYRITKVPMCRPEFLEMYLESSRDGCFVIEEKGQLIACAFSHIWGKIGWIGPIGVTPMSHLQGFGKQITNQCIEYLKQKGCTTIGLETMPRSYRNIGLYSKLGFIPEELTVDMVRPVPANSKAVHTANHQVVLYSACSEAEKKVFLERAKNLVQRLDPSLDYSILIQIVEKFKYGESLLAIRKSSTIMLAVILSHPTYSDEKQGILKVIALTTHPKMPDSYFPYIIQDFECLAIERHFDHLLLRVPTRCIRAYKFLLQEKFRIIHSDLRMTLEGYPKIDYSDYIHMDRWE